MTDTCLSRNEIAELEKRAARHGEWRFVHAEGEFHLMCGESEVLSFAYEPKTTVIALRQLDEWLILSKLNARAIPSETADSTLPFVVEYRPKPERQPRHSGAWRAMAAFDFEGPAQAYAKKCSDDDVPWEYRVRPQPATPTERDGKGG